MRTRQLTCFFIVAAALSLVSSPVPVVAGTAYMDAIVMGRVTEDGSNLNTFTLPAGDHFPQITSPDSVYGSDVACYAVTGIEMEFMLAVGVDAFEGMSGLMRLSLIFNDEEAALILGTFSLEFNAEPSNYTVHGTLAGDRYAIYLAGTDTMGTPDAGDDQPFLLRINGYAPDFLLSVDDVFFGKAGILVGDPSVQGVSDAVTADRSATGSTVDLGSFSAPFTFNQFTPPDGSGDLAVGSDSAAQFWTGFGYTGSMAGTGAEPLAGNFEMSLTVLDLSSGPNVGSGLALGRFELQADDGRYLEGLLLGDAAAPDATGIPVDGYMFSLAATRGGANEYFLGTFDGYLDGSAMDPSSHLSIDVDGGFWSTDSAPPGVVFVNHDEPLTAGSWNSVETLFRDMNGATDIKTVLYALGTSRTSRKLQAKYNHKKGRLYLYNPRLKSWVGGCRPGSTGVIRTPQARLSCADTFVGSTGEYLYIDWALQPTNRMAGTWSCLTKVADRTKLVEGWKMGMDEVEVQSP